MKTQSNRSEEVHYVVGDYRGDHYCFKKLKNARRYLGKIDDGRKGFIRKVTNFYLEVSDSEVIQNKP